MPHRFWQIGWDIAECLRFLYDKLCVAEKEKERKKKCQQPQKWKLIPLLFFEEIPVHYATRNAVMRGLISKIVWMGAEGSKAGKTNNQKIVIAVI